MNSKVMKSITPAIRWEDAFPTGNGNMGILVYGNICNDTIILNHEALWTPSTESELPDISKDLPELREMLLNGEYSMMDNFLQMMVNEKGGNLGQSKSSYHPAGELIIQSESHHPFQNYHRILDLESGLVTVQWEENGRHFKREHFVSRCKDIICIRISGDIGRDYQINLQPRRLSEENRTFLKNLKMSDIPIKFETTNENQFSILHGKYENGEHFGVIALIKHPNSSISSQINGFLLKKCLNTEILIKILPSAFDQTNMDNTKQELLNIKESFPELFTEHQQEHRELFNRVEYSIQQEQNQTNEHERKPMAATIDYQLLQSYNGEISEYLLEQLYYYGRFLLICSSRPGSWPANLQGVWNGNYFPAWSSDYHNDENVQMCYWAALPGNLAETTHAYFDFYEKCIPDCQNNARKLFGTRGIVIPIAQTIKGKAPPYGGPWLNWTAGAGWLAQLFFDYWLYTKDDEFLKTHAIPYLKEVAFFYEDFLFKGENGKYIICPSLSPENVPDIPGASLASINATMDIAVAKEVLTNLCDGCIYLGIEKHQVQKWQQMINNLPEYEINEDGAIREWIWPGIKDNYHHRHLSHIYGLFPGFEITETFMPRLYDACRIAVEKRKVVGQMSQSGWSLAHMANIYARLRQGNHALEAIQTLIRSCVGPNLFTYHNDWRHQGLTLYWGFIDRIFQIDANMGITAAMQEMILFSNRELIGILPACPEKWKKGRVKGLMARGGIKVDITWDFSKHAISVSLNSKFTQTTLLRAPRAIASWKQNPTQIKIMPSDRGQEYFSIQLEKNQPIIIDLVLV
jgi:alpha-L-fucosidase 2